MNKGFLTAFLVATAAFVAKADLLYWQIGDEKNDNIKWLEQRNDVEYKYASIFQEDGSGNKTLLTSYGPNSSLDSDTVEIGSLVAANIGSDYSAMNFYIELYDASFDNVATSNSFLGSALGAYISAAEFNENWTSANGAFGTATSGMEFVPEPTSGLLLLIGAAVLGLKRKRV